MNSHTRSGLTRAASIIAVLAAAGTAAAQTNSGNARSESRCGTIIDQAYGFPADLSFVTHGDCSAGPGGGLASTNDAVSSVKLYAGSLRTLMSARADYFGTHADAASANATTGLDFRATDVVFTNIANPNLTGIITVSMNFVFAAKVATQGASNCSGGLPLALTTYVMGAPGGNSSGSLSSTAGGAGVGNNALVGYPNDNSAVTFTTTPGGVDLTVNKTLELIADCRANTLDCDHGPPAELQTADSSMFIHLPCGTPVFNLPAGHTVNSTQLGIVNNIWGGLLINQQPADATACPSDSPAFTVVASGSGLITYQWQVEDSLNIWVNLSEGDNTLTDGRVFKAAAVQTPGLTLAHATGDAIILLGSSTRFRCVLTNDCGNKTTDPATLHLCFADMDCDHIVDLTDFFAFLNCFDQTQPCADLNGDLEIDLNDFFAFFNTFDQSC